MDGGERNTKLGGVSLVLRGCGGEGRRGGEEGGRGERKA
jgi:hypothetical protein